MTAKFDKNLRNFLWGVFNIGWFSRSFQLNFYSLGITFLLQISTTSEFDATTVLYSQLCHNRPTVTQTASMVVM